MNPETKTNLAVLFETIRLRASMANDYEKLIAELTSGDERIEFAALEGLRGLSVAIKSGENGLQEANSAFELTLSTLELAVNLLFMKSEMDKKE